MLQIKWLKCPLSISCVTEDVAAQDFSISSVEQKFEEAKWRKLKENYVNGQILHERELVAGLCLFPFTRWGMISKIDIQPWYGRDSIWSLKRASIPKLIWDSIYKTLENV